MLADCRIGAGKRWSRSVLFSTSNNAGNSAMGGGSAGEGEGHSQEGNFGVRHLAF